MYTLARQSEMSISTFYKDYTHYRLLSIVLTQVVARAPAAPCVSAPCASTRGYTAPPCGDHCGRDGQRKKHPDPPVHPGGDAGKRGGENKAV